MNWLEAAQAAPSVEAKDLMHLQLSEEESAKLIALYARSLSNARSDSADIAMIALKKALSDHPGWGEAALLFGICLAQDGKLKRAKASFEHALSVGLVSECATYLTQELYRDVTNMTENPSAALSGDEPVPGRRFLENIRGPKKASIFEAPDADTKGRMRAPILTRAPKSAAKAKLATDRERRDVLMQANASPETGDEEIDVSIPKTPAEKLRIFLLLSGVVLAAAALGLFVWYIAIPGVSDLIRAQQAQTRLDFLLTEMQKEKADPEIAKIMDQYVQEFAASDPANGSGESVIGSNTTGTDLVQTPTPTVAVTPQTTPTTPSQVTDTTTIPSQDSTTVSVTGETTGTITEANPEGARTDTTTAAE